MSVSSNPASKLFEVLDYNPKNREHGPWAIAKCDCGVAQVIRISSPGPSKMLPLEPVKRKFTNLGWRLGKKPGSHTCPECQTMKAAKPRSPTPAQRRSILDALEIVFTTEDGYDKGYDDEAVAKEQKVPRAWVTEVRETLLGPIPKPKENPHAEQINALKVARLKAQKMVEGMTEVIESIDRVLKGLEDKS